MLKTIKEVQRALSQRETSVGRICNQAYELIEASRNLNAYVTVRPRDEATQEADLLDSFLATGALPDSKLSQQYPMYGVPISIKDNFCTKQMLTTCGSKMLHNFVPPYDASVIARLKAAKCLIVGKTNMDEFAMGSSCTTSYYGPAANPKKSQAMGGKRPDVCDANSWFVAGGSSTGSAVSVATGACFASIGTDTGGSTRQPASLTGVVGFKPTYGLISRFGLIPLAHCLDVVSILARTVDDVAVIFNQMIGQDENDLTTVDHRQELKQRLKQVPLDRYLEAFRGTKIRIGIPSKFVAKGEFSSVVAEEYARVIKSLSNNSTGMSNLEVVEVDLPHSNLATECYTILSSTEIASNMSCYDGVKYGLSVPNKDLTREQFFQANRDAGFGVEVKKRILLGNYFLLEENRDRYLKQAQKMRRLISQDFEVAFRERNCHALLMPSTPTTSISYAEWLDKQDDNKLFREDYYLIPANLANIPSISLPSNLSTHSDLPIGLQLVADKFHDVDLLLLSKFFERHLLSRH